MRIVAIWTNETKDAMKIIRSKADFKNLKFEGRKPNRMILPAADLKEIKVQDLKKYISYTGLIITTSGRKIYDGRVKGK